MNQIDQVTRPAARFTVQPPAWARLGIKAVKTTHPCLYTHVRPCKEDWPDDSEMWCGYCTGTAQAISIRNDGNWSATWPTSPGWYWFYGRTSHIASEPRLMPAEVRAAIGSMVYIARGVFLYREEGAEGVWLLMAVPELPTEV